MYACMFTVRFCEMRNTRVEKIGDAGALPLSDALELFTFREREKNTLICVHHRVDVILKHPLRDPTCAPERHIINNKMRTARVTSKQILTTHSDRQISSP